MAPPSALRDPEETVCCSLKLPADSTISPWQDISVIYPERFALFLFLLIFSSPLPLYFLSIFPLPFPALHSLKTCCELCVVLCCVNIMLC